MANALQINNAEIEKLSTINAVGASQLLKDELVVPEPNFNCSLPSCSPGTSKEHFVQTENTPRSNLKPLEKNEYIKSQLAQWVSNFNISRSAVNELLQILKTELSYLPTDARTLMLTPRSLSNRIIDIPPGRYCHLGICDGLKYIFGIYNIQSHLQAISLNVNVDGLPIAKSSTSQFWPIIMSISRPDCYPEPFVVGVYHGNKKPLQANDFMKSFVDEMKELLTSGFQFNNTTIQVTLNAIICDAPAKAFILGVKGHTSYNGCNKCEQEGTLIDGRMTYQNGRLRTDESFRNMTDEDYHREKSILTELKIGLVSHVALDYMHLVCLGVVKRILKFYVCGAKNIRLNKLQIANVSEKLQTFKQFIPSEFARLPRPLLELDRWKATELRLFILYTGGLLLKPVLSQSQFTHYMTLHTATRILASKELSKKYHDYAKQLLTYFVEKYSIHYGKSFVTYNVHNLIHLADDVEKFGPLDSFSAFKYENELFKIKNMLQTSNRPLEQIINRIVEKEEIGHLSNEVKKFIKLLRRPAEDWHKFEIKVVAVYETYAEAVNKERRLVDYCLTSEENDEGRNQHRSHYSTKQLHVSPPPTLNKDPQTLIQLNNVSYDTYKDYRAMIDEPIPIIPEPSYSLEPREQPEALYELDNNLEIDAQNTPSGRSSNDFESELETRKNKEQSDLINQELLKRISGQVAQLLTLVNSMDDRLRRLEHKLNVQPRLLPEEDNIPKLPFKTIQELKTFETDYSDDVHNAMVNRVSLVSGKDMRTCIFNQLSDVLAPEVGHLCSWAGRNNNYSIQNTVITKILLDATRKNFPETKKNDFENVVKDWLKAGNQRYKRALQKQP